MESSLFNVSYGEDTFTRAGNGGVLERDAGLLEGIPVPGTVAERGVCRWTVKLKRKS